MLGVVVPLLAVAGTLAYAASFSVFGSAGAGMGMGAVLLTGVCYGWLEMRFLCEAARVGRFVDIVWILAASRIIKTVVVAILGSYDAVAQVAVDALMPVGIGALLSIVGGRAVAGASSSQPSGVPRVDRTTMIAFLIMYPVLNAVARALSNLGFWGSANVIDGASIASSLPASILFAAFVYFAFSRCQEEGIVGQFVRALLVLLACFLFLDEQTLAALGVATVVIDSLMTAVELFSHFLFWLIAVAAIRALDWPPVRSAAVSELVMSFAALVFGLALQGFSGLGRMIVGAAMYGVIVIALMLLWKMRESSLKTFDVDGLEDLCGRIAAEHGLSPRETEVFKLLAQGRSRSFIQEELVISDATVKSHINRVYQKLGIHSKQDLISLVRKR
ncbi:helix-turn-helix transcriptional regulator [Gordonibacter sp. An230]|uniref:helix-turn-helix transcriptional regulator n=1 Tax=Gordonibacter sp. An230 TaxID=1965592 RepID=UPI0013A667F1|nr:helix-turn-helix transcriptional regulator [Gordonibacter sp. An230]